MGYGNLGRGVKLAIGKSTDMELVAIFTRRPVETLEIDDEEIKVISTSMSYKYIDEIDVMILCGGSATDLPVQGPYFASMYNTVDSYDNHGNIPEYRRAIDNASRSNGKTSAICTGWDPGLFSMNRVIMEAILMNGSTYTFWGPGISQGHSDAIRRIAGVKDAVQYTVPKEEVVSRIRNGETPELNTRERHTRQCYVLLEEGVDKDKIENEIKSMPNYFAQYDTDVTFITEEDLKNDHSKMFHGGFVIRSGQTGIYNKNKHIAEFSLKLDCNSEFTSSILVAYARAVYRLNREGHFGAKTVFDIPVKYIASKPSEELYRNLL